MASLSTEDGLRGEGAQPDESPEAGWRLGHRLGRPGRPREAAPRARGMGHAGGQGGPSAHSLLFVLLSTYPTSQAAHSTNVPLTYIFYSSSDAHCLSLPKGGPAP